MKIIRKFDNAFSAHVCKGVLEENGIPAYILNENLTWTTGVANTDLISIQVMVDDNDYDNALEILEKEAD